MFWYNKYKITENDINRDRVLKVLRYYKNKEVNAWKLSYDAKVLHYTEAVMELRKLDYKIENRREWKKNTCYSFYKLVEDEKAKL